MAPHPVLAQGWLHVQSQKWCHKEEIVLHWWFFGNCAGHMLMEREDITHQPFDSHCHNKAILDFILPFWLFTFAACCASNIGTVTYKDAATYSDSSNLPTTLFLLSFPPSLPVLRSYGPKSPQMRTPERPLPSFAFVMSDTRACDSPTLPDYYRPTREEKYQPFSRLPPSSCGVFMVSKCYCPPYMAIPV